MQQLKPGIDIMGGTSLVNEVSPAGAIQDPQKMGDTAVRGLVTNLRGDWNESTSWQATQWRGRSNTAAQPRYNEAAASGKRIEETQLQENLDTRALFGSEGRRGFKGSEQRSGASEDAKTLNDVSGVENTKNLAGGTNGSAPPVEGTVPKGKDTPDAGLQTNGIPTVPNNTYYAVPKGDPGPTHLAGGISTDGRPIVLETGRTGGVTRGFDQAETGMGSGSGTAGAPGGGPGYGLTFGDNTTAYAPNLLGVAVTPPAGTPVPSTASEKAPDKGGQAAQGQGSQGGGGQAGFQAKGANGADGWGAGLPGIKVPEPVVASTFKPGHMFRQSGLEDGKKSGKGEAISELKGTLTGNEAGADKPAESTAREEREKDRAAAPDDAKPAGEGAPGPDAKPDAPPPVTPPAPGNNTKPAAPEPPPPPPAAAQRRIIRNGELMFEVDSFDSSMMQIAKIASEEGGFIATTTSEKLSNGKVKGTAVVRCAPERLDTLVLKLRGLGDLKSQRIAAQDVTKQYTDLESQLRAHRAMETRLLEIIKTGKGEVKDLIEAEKQLGVYKEKIEMLEGERRYLENLVTLSTLTVSLYERDIKTPTAAAEVENVDMGIVTEDVEQARAEAVKAIEAVKGKVIEAELKRHPGGQLEAKIVADVAPDASGGLTDRLKQLGTPTRLEINRRTVTQGGTGPVIPAVKVERKDTRFQIGLYNLTTVSPRQTVTMNLAAPDVEATYKAVLEQVKAGGGRVVSSQLNRPKPDQTTGTVVFQVPTDKADVVLAAVRAGADVMRMETAQNADTENVTEAKRGFVVQIFSLASVQPRETTALAIAAKDVPASYRKLVDAARAGGARIITSQLNEQDANNVSGTLEFEVMREQWAGVDAALREAGIVITRTVNRSQDAENTVDSKLRLTVSLMDDARLAPREEVGLRVKSTAVPDTFHAMLGEVRKLAGARVTSSQLNQQDKANVYAQIFFTVQREQRETIEQLVRGGVVSRGVAYRADGPTTVDTKIGFQVTIIDERTLGPREAVTMTVVVPVARNHYQAVTDVLSKLDVQVHKAQFDEQKKEAVLEFTIRAQDRSAVESTLVPAGVDVFGKKIDRSQDTQNTTDERVRLSVRIEDADQRPPREVTTMGVQVSNVDQSMRSLQDIAREAGGRTVDYKVGTSDNREVARVVVDVPLSQASQVLERVKGMGRVTTIERQRPEGMPEGSLSRGRLEVTFGSPGAIEAGDGWWESIRSGLQTSLTGLAYSLQFVIIGLLLVLPWAVIVWVSWKLIRRSRKARAEQRGTTPPAGRSTPPPASTPGGPAPTPA